MTNRKFIQMCALGLFSALALPAQNKPAGKIPRTPDGHPDLQGFWSNATRTPLERLPEFVGKATLTDAEARAWEQKEADGWKELDGTSDGPLHQSKGSAGTGAYNVLFYDHGDGLARVDGVKRTSLVIDPPDGKLPSLTEAARNRNRPDGRFTAYNSAQDRPLSERCLIGFGSTGGPPMLPVLYNNMYEIVQTPDAVMILVEMVHDARIIRINGTHPPASVRQWMGDTIGHWEGDTLVAETTNFTPQTRFRGSTPDLKVTERFTRVDHKTFLYKATMEDPGTWAKPWTIEVPVVASNGPIYEYACHEGNYAMTDILGGARKLEAAETLKK